MMEDKILEQMMEVHPSRFKPNSRYAHTHTTSYTTAHGHKIRHLKRRFIPPAERFTTVQEHQVEAGDRLDNLAARYIGDPIQYWRLCDANLIMHPEELTESVHRKMMIGLESDLEASH